MNTDSNRGRRNPPLYIFELWWLDKFFAIILFFRHWRINRALGTLDQFWCAISWYATLMDLDYDPRIWWDENSSNPITIAVISNDGELYDRIRFKRGELYEIWQDPLTQKTYRFYPDNSVKEC